jgi:hypothetical protein
MRLTDVFLVIFALIVIGVAWYLVDRYLPLPRPIKIVITTILVLALCAWMLDYFGLADFDSLRGRR